MTPLPIRATFRRDLSEDQSERQAPASVSPDEGSTTPLSARETCSQEPTEARSASLIDDGPAPSAALTEPVNGPAARIQEVLAVGDVGECREKENLLVEIPEPSTFSDRSLPLRMEFWSNLEKIWDRPEKEAPVKRSKPLVRVPKRRALRAKQLTMNTFGLRGTAVQEVTTTVVDGPVEDQEMVGVQQTVAITEHWVVDEQMDDVQQTAAITLPQPAVKRLPLAKTNNPRPVTQPPPKEKQPERVPEARGFFRFSKRRDAVREIRQRLFAYAQMTPGELEQSDVHQCLVDAHTYYTTPHPDGGGFPLDDIAPALTRTYCDDIEALVRQSLASHHVAEPEKNITLLLCLELQKGSYLDFSRGSSDKHKKEISPETAAARELIPILHWSAGALQYHLAEAKLLAANKNITLSHLFSATKAILQEPTDLLREISHFAATAHRHVWRALAHEKIRLLRDREFCEDLTLLRLGIMACTLASGNQHGDLLLLLPQQQQQQQQHWIVGLKNCCKRIQDSVYDLGGRRV